MTIRHLAVSLAASFLLVGGPASAQTVPTTLAGTIIRVDGTPFVERDLERLTAAAGQPLLAGDRIRSGDGRLAVSLAGAGRVYLDVETVVDLRSSDLLSLQRGRLEAVVAAEPGRLDTPASQVRFERSGRYRITVAADGTSTVAVFHGLARVRNDLGQTSVEAGQRIETRVGGAPSMPTSFNTASLDREPFSRWVARVSPRADRYASRIIRPPLRAGAGLARVVAARLTHMPSRSAVENAAFDPTRWLPTWPYRVLGSGAVNCCEAAARPEPRPTVAQPIIIVASEPTARPQPEADGDAAPPVYVSSGIRDPDAALRLPRQRLGARTMNVRLPARSTRYTRMSGRSARRSATRTGRVSASTRDRP